MESGEISNEVITASSALRVNYEPWLARLHSQLGEGGWCAGVSKHFYLIYIRIIQMALTIITLISRRKPCVRRKQHDGLTKTLNINRKASKNIFCVCSQKNDENQYLEIDLQRLHHVKRVATQGKYSVPGCISPDAWVTSYIMQFRQDTIDWWNYTEDGKTRVRRKIVLGRTNQRLFNVCFLDWRL